MNPDLVSPLPFEPADARFGAILETRFLKPAILWMLGQRDEQGAESIFSSLRETEVEHAKCWWGMGLYLEAFVNCLHMPELFSESERVVFAQVSLRLAHELLSAQRPNGSWDDVTWDTSVICRALLLLYLASRSQLHISFSNDLTRDITSATQLALKWLTLQTVSWDAVRYPFGPEDLAMIVRLLCTVEQSSLVVFPRIDGDTLLPKNGRPFPESTRELAESLVERLLDMQVVEPKPASAAPQISWGSPFSTAHTVQAFSEAMNILPETLKTRCLQSLTGAIAHIESTQDEGRWGMPNSTSLMLLAYIVACELLGRLEDVHDVALSMDAEIIFKSLRWLSDPKQRFADGSLLHTFTHTAFFVLMLQGMVSLKPLLLAFPVIQLYDYVIWNDQVRPSKERGERLKLTDELIRRNRDLVNYQRFYNRAVNSLRAFIVLVSVSAFLAISGDFGWLDVKLSPLSLSLVRPDLLLTGCGLVASAISAILLFSRRWLRPEIQHTI